MKADLFMDQYFLKKVQVNSGTVHLYGNLYQTRFSAVCEKFKTQTERKCQAQSVKIERQIQCASPQKAKYKQRDYFSTGARGFTTSP